MKGLSDLAGKVFAESKRRRGKDAMDPPTPPMPKMCGGKKEDDGGGDEPDAAEPAADPMDELTGGDMGKDMAVEDLMSALESKDTSAVCMALEDFFEACCCK